MGERCASRWQRRGKRPLRHCRPSTQGGAANCGKLLARAAQAAAAAAVRDRRSPGQADEDGAAQQGLEGSREWSHASRHLSWARNRRRRQAAQGRPAWRESCPPRHRRPPAATLSLHGNSRAPRRLQASCRCSRSFAIGAAANRPHLQCFSLITALIAARAPSMVDWEGAMANTRAERARLREKGRPTTQRLPTTDGDTASMERAVADWGRARGVRS